MGTIIRTADAAGFSGVIVLKGCVDIYNPKVIRSTAGSIFHIPVVEYRNNALCLQELCKRNIKIISTTMSSDRMIYDVDISGNSAILIGNEATGISKELLNAAEINVRIPMPGSAESLNASVAAGILIYESVRQRKSN